MMKASILKLFFNNQYKYVPNISSLINYTYSVPILKFKFKSNNHIYTFKQYYHNQ